MPKTSIAEVIKLASNSGCPEFDSDKFFLGDNCPRKHLWGDTGKCLRQYKKPGKSCPFIICEHEAKQKSYKKKQLEERIKAFQSGDYPKVTLFTSLGYTAFNYSDYPLEVYIRYGIDFDAARHVSNKVCKHGHFWLDTHHSLRENCKPNDCFICSKIWTRERIDSGKNAETRARHYAKHRNAHNQDCLERYYRNHETCRERQNATRRLKRDLLAKEELDQFYYGKPCKICSNTYRYTLGSECVECARRKSKEWAKENPEKKYEQGCKWAKENPEKMRAYRKKWIQENPDKYYKAWLKCTEHHKTLFTVLHTFEEAQKHLEAFNHSCAYCEMPLDYETSRSWAWDHFIPKKIGGTNTLKNYVPACWHCNSSKNAIDPWKWYQRQEFFLERRWNKILEILEKTHENYLEIPYS